MNVWYNLIIYYRWNVVHLIIDYLHLVFNVKYLYTKKELKLWNENGKFVEQNKYLIYLS